MEVQVEALNYQTNAERNNFQTWLPKRYKTKYDQKKKKKILKRYNNNNNKGQSKRPLEGTSVDPKLWNQGGLTQCENTWH